MSEAKALKIEVLISNAAGLYGVPYSKGKVGLVESKVAKEMIKAKHAKSVK